MSSTSWSEEYLGSPAVISKDLRAALVALADRVLRAEEGSADRHHLAGDLLHPVDQVGHRCRMAWDLGLDPDLMAWDHHNRHISPSGLTVPDP